MVAKTVAVDPHLSDGSVEDGKVPPSHGSIDTPLSMGSQVSRSASDQDNDSLQSNSKSTKTSLDEFNPVMSEWSTQEACLWLERVGLCETSALRAAIENDIDGDVLENIAYDPQANEVLEKIFCMDQYAARFMLIQKLKRSVKASQAHIAAAGSPLSGTSTTTTSSPVAMSPSPAPSTTFTTALRPSTKTTPLAGEKTIVIPPYPKKSDSEGLIYFQDWHKFMSSVKMWAQISSVTYPKLLQSLYDEPTLEVGEGTAKALASQEIDMKIDCLLGVHLG